MRRNILPYVCGLSIPTSSRSFPSPLSLLESSGFVLKLPGLPPGTALLIQPVTPFPGNGMICVPSPSPALSRPGVDGPSCLPHIPQGPVNTPLSKAYLASSSLSLSPFPPHLGRSGISQWGYVDVSRITQGRRLPSYCTLPRPERASPQRW